MLILCQELSWILLYVSYHSVVTTSLWIGMIVTVNCLISKREYWRKENIGTELVSGRTGTWARYCKSRNHMHTTMLPCPLLFSHPVTYFVFLWLYLWKKHNFCKNLILTYNMSLFLCFFLAGLALLSVQLLSTIVNQNSP